MKPAPFEYVRAESVEEAFFALTEAEGDAKVLAGGQSLLPALNMRLLRPETVVDLNRVPDLDDVLVENGRLCVGALVRQADPLLRTHPLLAEAIPYVGHVVTRNRGTVAGSIAHADPSAELPLCLALLGGSVVVRGAGGEREIPTDDLFVGPYTTTISFDEVVVETRWPMPGPGWGYAFCELAQRHGDYALCAAAAAVGDGELRVAVGAVTPFPTLLEVDPEAPGEWAAEQVDPWGSIHASPAYLKQLTRVLVDRAVAVARERAA